MLPAAREQQDIERSIRARDRTLRETIDIINAVPTQPDFVIFTGDLTQTTDDSALRRSSGSARAAHFPSSRAAARPRGS